jgi:ketosteroid isomerase-like protein
MRKKYFYLSIFLLLCGSIKAQYKVDAIAEKAIQQTMKAQEDFWNKGDIDSFMKLYCNNPALVFVGKSGPTFGYHNTLKNYKKGYPDKDSMGQLHFDILHTQQWDENTIQLIGKYTLKREKDQPTGYFTLLFRKINSVWKIVSDHSSSS